MDNQPQGGVSTHSQPDNYIVWSVYDQTALNNLGEYPSTLYNAMKHSIMKVILNELDIDYKEVLGCYEGDKEVSFVINAKHFDKIKPYLLKHNQRTYMLLTNHKHGLRKASIIASELEPTKKHAEMFMQGYLRSVPEEVALAQVGWSYCPILKKYFAISESDDTISENYGGLLNN